MPVPPAQLLPGPNFTAASVVPQNFAPMPPATPDASAAATTPLDPARGSRPQPSRQQRDYDRVYQHMSKLKEMVRGREHVTIQFQEMNHDLIPNTLKDLPKFVGDSRVPLQTLAMDFSAMAGHGFNIARNLKNILAAIEALSEKYPNAKIELDLRGCGINVEHAKLIADSLRKSGNRITSLRVSNNPIGGQGVKALFHALPESLVETLEIDKCGVDKLDLPYVANKLPDCTNLRHLSMRNNGLKENGMELFAMNLKKAIPLESLSISHNRIGIAGLGHLSKILAVCPQLKRLEAQNCIHDQVAQAQEKVRGFARAVAGCEKLEALMFGANPGLWDDHLAVVVDSALKMPSLTTLDISLTFAERKTAETLQNGLPASPLKKLNVNYCNFAEDEAKLVVEGVARSSSMKALKMSGIWQDSKGGRSTSLAELLISVIALSKGLQRVDWSENGLTEEELKVTLDTITNNPDNQLTHLDISDKILWSEIEDPDRRSTFKEPGITYIQPVRNEAGLTRLANRIRMNGIVDIAGTLAHENCHLSYLELRSTPNVMTRGLLTLAHGNLKDFSVDDLRQAISEDRPLPDRATPPGQLKVISTIIAVDFELNSRQAIPWLQKHYGVRVLDSHYFD